jgi:riboflavin biosynthesis pyrimidine reductase
VKHRRVPLCVRLNPTVGHPQRKNRPVRQLVPEPVDSVEPLDVYRDLPIVAGRPAVRLNMISSVDGSTAVGGLSGGLGGPADHRVFSALRALADVVLVAAGTVRAETYGPADLPIAVVSGSLRLDWDTPFFTAATHRPLVVTHRRAPAADVMRASKVADVVVAGESEVDLARAVEQLGERGFVDVLAEGGPSLNGALAAAGVLDELCLTLAPRLVSGDAKRILTGAALISPPELVLRSLCEEDGYLFLRYRFPAAANGSR